MYHQRVGELCLFAILMAALTITGFAANQSGLADTQFFSTGGGQSEGGTSTGNFSFSNKEFFETGKMHSPQELGNVSRNVVSSPQTAPHAASNDSGQDRSSQGSVKSPTGTQGNLSQSGSALVVDSQLNETTVPDVRNATLFGNVTAVQSNQTAPGNATNASLPLLALPPLNESDLPPGEVQAEDVANATVEVEPVEEEAPEDRIWREGISSEDYTWTPLSFSGFFYDMDDQVGTERLTVHIAKSGDTYGRTIGQGDLRYTSQVQEIGYKFGEWGGYQVIGFLADKYFAGYLATDVIDKDYSIINNGELRKVLIDSDDDRTITTGSVLPLEEGYELRIKEIDINGNKVYLALAKDGDEVDSKVISPSNTKSSTYMYKVKIGGEDTPIVMGHIANVFQGAESSVVTVDGIFQISDTYSSVEDGDEFDKMKVTSVSDSGIEMSNEDSFTLRRGKTVNFMGKVGFEVADSEVLRFAPTVERTGSYEIRGTVINPQKVSQFQWTPYNFAGFYYDIDDDVGGERLRASILGGSIAEGDLRYETEPQPVKFEYEDWGKYDVIGFMAEKYFAGYNSESHFTDEFSAINEGQLRKVLVDSDIEQSLTTGSVLSMEEGYELRIKEVDLDGNKVFLALVKDGDEVTSKVLTPSAGDIKSSTFLYKEKIGSDEVPIISAHVENVFRGTEADLATIKGVFQISDSPASVESGEVHGKMKVDSLSDAGITMKNDNTVSLGRGKKVDVMGNMKFLVADNSDRNFCPVVERIAKTSPLKVNVSSVVVNRTTTVEVTSDGKPIAGVKVTVDKKDIGTTDTSGAIRYTPDKAGTFQVQAKLEGYPDGSATLVVRSDAEVKRLNINVPSQVVKGESFLITVTGGLNLTPIPDAALSFDANKIGVTDSQGTLSYISNATGTHSIEVTKEGYTSTSKNITVTSPVSVQGLNLSGQPEAGRSINVAVLVKNTGRTDDSRTVDLRVNGQTVDTKEVLLKPGESKEISFEYRPKDPGVYTFESEGRQQTVTVEEAKGNNMLLIALLLILIIVIGAGIYLYRTGELNALRERLQKR